MEREILEILGLFIIGAPLLSLSVRLAMRPIVGAVRDLRTAFETLSPATPAEPGRQAQLEAEIQELRSRIEAVDEALDFDRRLRDPSSHAAPALPRT